LPPSALADPNDYVRRLDEQMREINQLHSVKDWRNYLKTASKHLVPYVRSVAAGRMGLLDDAYCELSSTAQPPGIWRSIADGVSSFHLG
jgi:hypothetical protein